MTPVMLLAIAEVLASFSLEPRGPTRSDPFAHEAIHAERDFVERLDVAFGQNRSLDRRVSAAIYVTPP